MFNVNFLLLALAVPALASPVKREDSVDDTTVLNFALTLEHLENNFYSTALAKFDAKAFTDAGLPSYARGRFEQIAAHEKTHVEFLSTALGDNATQPCNYTFPYTDPASFAALSQVIEGVGVSAYTGAASLITNKDYLTAAASVLSTEARHASWVASAVNKVAGWSTAFDVPLELNEVYSLAAPFISSCPSSNPTLPVMAYPTLAFSPAAPKAGASATLKLNDTASADYACFLSGLDKTYVAVSDGKVKVPKDLMGTVYVVATKGNGTDATVVAGPAVLAFEFDSAGKVQ